MSTIIAPSADRKEIYGFPVVGHQVVYQNGCFRRVRYWLKGHVPGFNLYAKFITGLTGPETVIEIEQIFPTAAFEVTE
jgi:hypothetical protein